MSFNPYKNPNNFHKNKKPVWPGVILSIVALIIVTNLASRLGKNLNDRNPQPLTQRQIAAIENKKKEEEFSNSLENNIKMKIGNAYGYFIIYPHVGDNLCRFTLTFKRSLSDKEAREAGTLAVRAMLEEYQKTDKVERIIRGNLEVAAKIYSLKQLPAGELKEDIATLTYMGQAIYNPKTNQTDWTHKRW